MTNPPANLPAGDKSRGRLISGRWIVLGIAIVGLAMAGFAWLYWYRLGKQAQRYWGTDVSLLISRAPNAELLELGEPDTANNAEKSVLVGNELLPVLRRHDLMHPPAPGWENIRTLLLRDAAYVWSDSASCRPKWRYALQLSENYRHAVILISLQCPRLALADGTRVRLRDGTIETARVFTKDGQQGRSPVSIKPIAHGLDKFVQAQFAEKRRPKGQ